MGHPPAILWAVRSSATTEDATDSSSAGLCRTYFGRTLPEAECAIKDL
ncbi:MAG: hypothetical protein JSR31_11605 [Nitrospira sp.]|nr:hypothetical protein [Nitrospira sp.]